jgi:hypothetical protein
MANFQDIITTTPSQISCFSNTSTITFLGSMKALWFAYQMLIITKTIGCNGRGKKIITIE